MDLALRKAEIDTEVAKNQAIAKQVRREILQLRSERSYPSSLRVAPHRTTPLHTPHYHSACAEWRD